jgi:hypothetical protein
VRSRGGYRTGGLVRHSVPSLGKSVPGRFGLRIATVPGQLLAFQFAIDEKVGQLHSPLLPGMICLLSRKSIQSSVPDI